MQNFVEKNPKALISKVLLKIIENKSEIKVFPENKEKANIYVIAIEEAKTYNKALEKSIDYILKGEDYIHPLNIKINETIRFYVAYRFYSDKQKAEEMRQMSLMKLQQEYGTSERIAGQEFTAGQNKIGQEFTAGQNKINNDNEMKRLEVANRNKLAQIAAQGKENRLTNAVKPNSKGANATKSKMANNYINDLIKAEF